MEKADMKVRGHRERPRSREDETDSRLAHCRAQTPGPVFWLWTVIANQPSRRIRQWRDSRPQMSITAARPRRNFTAFPFVTLFHATGFAAARGQGESNKSVQEMQERRKNLTI